MKQKGRYIEGFRTWLQVLNYNKTSIQTYPINIERLLSYMAENEVPNIESITGARVKNYFEYLSTLPSRTGQAYKLGTLRVHLTTAKLFAKYLRETGQGQIDVPVQYCGKTDYKPAILTESEIKTLYESIDDNLLGIRDRAILAVYYGCGVRRNEGANIRIKDILPDRNLVYITAGKNYKERYIPMVGQVKKDIIEYLTIARPSLLNKRSHEYFFVSYTGHKMPHQSIYGRVKDLLKKAQIDKPVGLHGLRHSIATHLLHQGMKLTDIARFLGHATLESTQIYTHIEADTNKDNNSKQDKK